MFGKILKTPEASIAFKMMKKAAVKKEAAPAQTSTQRNVQKKKKKKVQPQGRRMYGTGSKSKARSLIDPM